MMNWDVRWDKVLIVESRPLSREKRWVVESIVRRTGEPVTSGEKVEGEQV